jgi:proline dehydrogenase
MEAHETVDDTIRMYLSELRKGMVGICLQSCLRRSMNDLKEISEMKGTVRLVKGAYKEDGYGAFPTRQQTTQNYSRMVRYLFRSFEGRNFMIATHDPRMMEQAFRLERITGKKPMYAMLNGIRNNYAAKLARHNDVSLYVPFGSAWVPYAIRRLREEGHLGLLLRSLFEQQDLV